MTRSQIDEPAYDSWDATDTTLYDAQPTLLSREPMLPADRGIYELEDADLSGLIDTIVLERGFERLVRQTSTCRHAVLIPGQCHRIASQFNPSMSFRTSSSRDSQGIPQRSSQRPNCINPSEIRPQHITEEYSNYRDERESSFGSEYWDYPSKQSEDSASSYQAEDDRFEEELSRDA